MNCARCGCDKPQNASRVCQRCATVLSFKKRYSAGQIKTLSGQKANLCNAKLLAFKPEDE